MAGGGGGGVGEPRTGIKNELLSIPLNIPYSTPL